MVTLEYKKKNSLYTRAPAINTSFYHNQTSIVVTFELYTSYDFISFSKINSEMKKKKIRFSRPLHQEPFLDVRITNY